MSTSPEVIILTVDIKANTERLVELRKELNANADAQKALAAANKAGNLSSDELAAGQVRLKATAAGLTGEQRTLIKANAQQDAANKAATGSTEQLRIQYQQSAVALSKLSQEERDNTAAGQKLQAQTKALNDEISKQEQAYGQFGRNVGNYAGSIGPLIQELVKLQEQQKTIPEGTAAYAQAQAKVIGFQQAVNNAGVKAGLTYDQTQAKIAGYGTAIAPVTAKIVQLEAEQKKAGEGSKEYAKIGFQIGAVKKELDKIPETAIKTSDSIKAGFQAAADKGLSPFKAQLEQSTGLLGKFKGGADLVKTGLSSLKGAGEEGAGGFKAVAAGIALTGIGLFIIAISAVVGYFTSTNEGGKILKQGLAGLGAVVTSVANLFTGAGKAGVEAFKNPRVAVEEFMNFLKGQVVNRLAAFGVLLDGIRNRDFKKITDSVLQFQLGITNGTDKIAAFANGIGDAVTNAATLEAQFQTLKKSRAKLEADEILEKGRVEELIRLSKDRTVSAGNRLAQLREAGKLEAELSGKSIKQITDELNAIKQRNAAKGLSRTTDEIQEERDKQKEYNTTVVERNNTLATIKARQSRFILEERAELLKDQKERVSAAQTARENAVKALINQNSKALAVVQEGSAAELVLKQRAVELGARMELAGAKKSTQDREAVEIKKNGDIAKLTADFNQKAIEAAKKATEATAAEAERKYVAAQKALEDSLNAKRAAIERDYAAGKFGENQYQKQLNAIELAGNAAALVNAREYAKEEGTILKKQADAEIKERNRVKAEKKSIAETEAQIRTASFQATAIASDFIIEAFGKESDAGRAALALKKTVALAEIAINLEKQLSANALTASKIAAEYPYVGPALAVAYEVAQDALAIAGAAAGAAKIAGFKQGGYVSGAGTGTSDSIPARLSNGESVMNANTTAAFAPLLSHLNVLGGGVAFASGGLVPSSAPRATPINDGGLIARQLGGAAAAIDYEALAHAMSRISLEVGITPLRRAEARYDSARAQSTLS